MYGANDQAQQGADRWEDTFNIFALDIIIIILY